MDSIKINLYTFEGGRRFFFLSQVAVVRTVSCTYEVLGNAFVAEDGIKLCWFIQSNDKMKA